MAQLARLRLDDLGAILGLVAAVPEAQLAGLAAASAARRAAAEARLAAGVKACARCQRVLRLDAFSARRGRVDGRNSVCLECCQPPAATR